ncbi:LuxR C-terminal-related transcriptional regulator [Sphaerisporangium dianthi]|uniref:LuxR C-terminal-related transcriptional regulator n=1 Tax=Sphaerisporangium dianthi TaxID=1436120 RepID=A0ABV9CLW3_9ACTN
MNLVSDGPTNDRDRLLIVMLASGYTTTRIAREMRLSRYTVAERISKLLERFSCSNRSQLVAYSYVHELLHVGIWPPCASDAGELDARSKAILP